MPTTVFQRGGRSVLSTVTSERAVREADAIVAAAGDAILGTATAPSGTEVIGDRRLVVATASGDFAAKEGHVATKVEGGWTFREAVPGERFAIAATRQVVFYDATLLTLRPLNAPANTSEQDTGRLGPNGNRVWRKVIAFGAAPNTTSKSVAHGVTSLPVGKGAYLFARATASNGVATFPVPIFAGATTISLAVDATNVTVVSAFDATAYDIIVELEYER